MVGYSTIAPYLGIIAVVGGVLAGTWLHYYWSSETKTGIEALIRIPFAIMWALSGLVTALTISPLFGFVMLAIGFMLVLQNGSRARRMTQNTSSSYRRKLSNWDPGSWGKR